MCFQRSADGVAEAGPRDERDAQSQREGHRRVARELRS